MKNKKNFIIRLINYILITIFLIYQFIRIPNGKIIFIPFLICSFSMLGKSIFELAEKQRYVKVFNKIFILSFLSFWFGLLIYFCYKSIIDKNYTLLLFSIPFWIAGIVVVRKNFFKMKNIPTTFKIKSAFNFKIIVSSVLVIVTFLSGILMLFFGIKGTYKSNIETKNYITTNGYYKYYDIYETDKDGTTYKLTYIYEVDNKEYTITTNYGTNYIPEEGSIREIKFNPEKPEEAILVGTNTNKALIYMGIFFILGTTTFGLAALTILGYFDKFRVDIIGTYIGIVFLIVGIGIIMFQNGTTMSLIETIKSFRVWMIIPLMFIIVGIFQIVKCLFFKDNRINNKKK